MIVEVTHGRAAWRGADLKERRDWAHELSPAEVDELRGVVERVRNAGLALDGLRREDVPLPLLSSVIDGWADELDAGRGFVLVRGVPADELGEEGSAIAYVALGVHLGVPVSQNAAGDLLGHVRDDGSDPDDPTVRRYRTRLAQPFHVDGSDVVGLLCLQPAKSGGLSQIVSSVTVFEEVARRRPDLVGTSSGWPIARPSIRARPTRRRSAPGRDRVGSWLRRGDRRAVVSPPGRAEWQGLWVDFTPEMLDLARRNAVAAGADNVEFLEGRIDAVPLPDRSVDVIISNYVVNLAVDKPAVFAEMHRVLRPGGRIGISDVVAEDRLSAAERAERGSYVGCIAGALAVSDYRAGLEAAGLADVSIDFTHEVGDGVHAAIIRATRPAE